jgi:hypothetical protein
MSKGRDKTVAQNQYQTALTNASTVTPLQQAQEARQLAALQWRSKPGRDVGELEGVSDYLQIGNKAVARAQQQRQGSGALNLGAPGSEQQAANLRTMLASDRAAEFGAGLENAVSSRLAEASNSVMPLASLNLQRNLGVLNTTAGRYNLERQMQGNMWGNILGAGATLGGSYLQGRNS